MIKIIESGKKEFVVTCPRCGCKFSYQLEDLCEYRGDEVKCPECGNGIYHENQIQEYQKLNNIGIHPIHNPEPLNITWGTQPEPIECKTCPNKPDPTKTTIGDTPCTFCLKNQFTCTSK